MIVPTGVGVGKGRGADLRDIRGARQGDWLDAQTLGGLWRRWRLEHIVFRADSGGHRVDLLVAQQLRHNNRLHTGDDDGELQQQYRGGYRVLPAVARQVAFQLKVGRAQLFAMDKGAAKREQDASRQQKIDADGDLIDQRDKGDHAG